MSANVAMTDVVRAENSNMLIQVEMISPEKAARYLAMNRENRPLKRAVVRRFSKALRDGHWKVTHQGIAFAQDGSLLDGQHRLTAIAETGVPAAMMVVRNVKRDVFNVIDTGAARSKGDFLALKGHKQATRVAAALTLKWLYTIANGDLSARLVPEKSPDNEDIEYMAEEHPRLVEIAKTNLPKDQAFLITPSWMACLRYEMESKDAWLADSFWKKILEGSNLEPTSIIGKARNRLIRISQETAGRSSRHTMVQKAAIIIKTWNEVRAGREHSNRTIVRWNASKSGNENFPQII